MHSTSDDPSAIGELERAITKALSFSYAARSSLEGKETGNKYQSVKLGDAVIPGFRSSREQFLDLFDWNGARVLDIGSNLGEMSRHALSRGAAHVHGVEYDPLFVLLSDLIAISNRIESSRYTFEQADVTKEFDFSGPYDVVLAFSVFTYISQRIPEVSEATMGLFLLETHNVDPDWELIYVAPLKDQFETIVVIGESDWGTAKDFSQGRRLILACFKRGNLAWDLFNRVGATTPDLSTRMMVDLWNSDIHAYTELKDYLRQHDISEVDDVPAEQPVTDALGLAEPRNPNRVAYWLEYYRGYRHYRDHDFAVTDANPYVRMVRRMVASGPAFDPFVLRQFEDPRSLQIRVQQRFADFKVIDEFPRDAELQTSDDSRIVSAVLFDVEGKPHRVHVVGRDSSRVAGSGLDGYHRLGAALLSGRGLMPVYHFRTFGSI